MSLIVKVVTRLTVGLILLCHVGKDEPSFRRVVPDRRDEEPVPKNLELRSLPFHFFQIWLYTASFFFIIPQPAFNTASGSKKFNTVVLSAATGERGFPVGNMPKFERLVPPAAYQLSSINDGGAALIVADADWAKSKGLKPLAEIVGWSTYSQEPEWFTTAPEKAVKKLLEKLSWKIEDVDFFELNEAFAVVSIYNNRALGLDGSNVNVRGGAVAIGHPIGASGARILVTLLHILKQEGKKRGIASLCNGGGKLVPRIQKMVEAGAREISEAKVAMISRPGASRMIWWKASSRTASEGVVPGWSALVLSDRNTNTPRLPNSVSLSISVGQPSTGV